MLIKLKHWAPESRLDATLENENKFHLALVYFYCINECLVWSCSVSVNSCKSESVKLVPEATLKVSNSQNSCTGWASACTKHQLKYTAVLHSLTT